MLRNPLLLGQDIVPDKYRMIFTGKDEEDLKNQYTAFSKYFEAFIQDVSFFKYLTEQIDHRTRDPQKKIKKKNTAATFHWNKEGVGFRITYRMGRKKGLLDITHEYMNYLKTAGTCG